MPHKKSLFSKTRVRKNKKAETYKIKKQRCDIFINLMQLLDDEATHAKYVEQGKANLKKWQQAKSSKKDKAAKEKIQVIQGDWGSVTKDLTKKHGVIFAVLNMANAYSPGGGVEDGAAAQEENMFRRTDCYKYVTAEEAKIGASRHPVYHQSMSDLINGKDGKVFIDIDHPRVCIQGQEYFKKGETSDKDSMSGYDPLPDDEVFMFYELRSAAIDCRTQVFNKDTTRKKIQAQLDTLIENEVRNVVLSAFGCGAFKNPPEEVAQIYQEELAKRIDHFDHVVFAIYYPGYGKDVNFKVFNEILSGDDAALLKKFKHDIDKLCAKLKKEIEWRDTRFVRLFFKDELAVKQAKYQALSALAKIDDLEELRTTAQGYLDDKQVMRDVLTSRTKDLLERIAPSKHTTQPTAKKR